MVGGVKIHYYHTYNSFFFFFWKKKTLSQKQRQTNKKPYPYIPSLPGTTEEKVVFF